MTPVITGTKRTLGETKRKGKIYVEQVATRPCQELLSCSKGPSQHLN